MLLSFLFDSADSNRFVPLLNVYFHVYVVLGLLLQALLLLLIITKSPTSLADLKLFLYNTTLCQIANILETYFLQFRALSNSTTLAVLANGPCRIFGPETCFATYHIFVIIPFTATWNFEIVKIQSEQEHSSHSLTIYSPYPGFSETQSFRFLFNTGLIALGSYVVPLISIITIRKILIVTKGHSKMSKKSKHQGLACQILLPLISYLPIITFYLITQFTAEEFLITEHLLNVMTSFPALIDPLISFYFIVPYRVVILRIINTKIVNSTVEISVHVPPAVSNRATGAVQ
uniref:Uncharacterized protein n=1 Tax=Caenorhabditis japonica TaxID=281687 RepID=A0A8R1HRW1_CAEJA